MQDRTKKFDKLCLGMMETYRAKNHDYGDSSSKTYDKFGVVSYLTRMNDKMNRIEQLTYFNQEQMVKGESAIDNLLDLASYCLQMAIDLHDKEPF